MAQELSLDHLILLEGTRNDIDVRIYDYNGSAWVQVGEDIVGEGNDNFGHSVSIYLLMGQEWLLGHLASLIFGNGDRRGTC